MTYIHTSGSYSEHNHERMLGEVLRGRPRDTFIVGSSPDLPYRFDPGGLSEDLGTNADPSAIEASIDGSLERLGLDVIDIYYLSSISRRETVLHEPYIKAFENLKRRGKARFAGIGTHRNEPDVIRAAAESGFWDVVLTAYNFRQSHRADVRAAIRQAAGAGLGVIAMKTQAGVYWDNLRQRKINMKAALKWVLQDENVHSSIPAFSNYEELAEDFAVMKDLNLSPEEERDLRLGDEARLSGLYCQQCARCVAQCPNGVEIPTLMRGYMYAVGYQDPQLARRTLRAWTSADVPCGDCGRCFVQCALGFDVRSRALDVARLLDTRISAT
jgi:predicted aldo/keto reductase-like oxidoreductase